VLMMPGENRHVAHRPSSPVAERPHMLCQSRLVHPLFIAFAIACLVHPAGADVLKGGVEYNQRYEEYRIRAQMLEDEASDLDADLGAATKAKVADMRGKLDTYI